MAQSGYDINSLFREAQSRWLKPAEVLFILQNHEQYELTHAPPQKPTSGSLYLFNKRVLRFFRKDGHSWRKKKDGKNVGEAHERLKVGNAETLNCYYAHGEQNPSFQRRSFWMLDPAYEHIVLVHYRDTNEARSSPASVVQSPVSSSVLSTSLNSYTSQNPGSNTLTFDLHEAYQNLSSPGSVEVSSDIVTRQALKRLEEQLSLTEDSLEEVSPFCNLDASRHESMFLEYGGEIAKPDRQADLLYEPGDIAQGKNGEHCQAYGNDNSDGSKESLYWNNVLDSYTNQSGVDSQGKPLSSSRKEQAEHREQSGWLNFNASNFNNSSVFLRQEVESVEIPSGPAAIQDLGTGSNYYKIFNQEEIGIPLAPGSSLTVARKQKFTIQEISPQWGYTSEVTKVIIVGSFLCDPLESTWACMFGETEVQCEIIQDGVICCKAPPQLPGKVTLCITSGNRESCSEIREFEYRVNSSSCTQCNLSNTEATKSPEELLLLLRFVQVLLSDSSLQKDSIESGIHLPRKFKTDDDSWNNAIEALLTGSGSSSGTVDWLLQELLKDKLQQWLHSRSNETLDQSGCTMSKQEQGIIHMAAGLGFEWALNPILNCGISINFRDINGWTALHWAARFGRENMVAALIASGASSGAVTDPTSQDLTGKTAASIAASSGHKGLAGYLSEVALTSHLSSLTLEESEHSKRTAALQAEMAVNSIPNESFANSEDQLSLKDTLAAVRNAAQAAARIQNAFRAHSFRKRQEKEVVAARVDEYNICPDEIEGLSIMPKLAFRNSAALSIQKKFRGWKSRKDFLALRRKVVKIQAHVRGYQVRKNYRVICWAVGFLDKAVLRWRRKGAGLRGFRSEPDPIDGSEDEDILKVFRKKKVDGAVDEDVSRVVSMVDSPDARQQYRRMLERYRQAKAQLTNTSGQAESTSEDDFYDMGSDDFLWFQ
ncbi:hypothetical protein V6N13_124491 [Hibiscus sabdariffa]|uniref:CG-1 domain-containing protein n=1 Tax=Hibiscus sabdariffa TaxID=183260 RepID=A0ABR2S2G3_9ROSI